MVVVVCVSACVRVASTAARLDSGRADNWNRGGVDSNQNGIERPIAGVTAFDRVVDEAPDCQAEKKVGSRMLGPRDGRAVEKGQGQ